MNKLHTPGKTNVNKLKKSRPRNFLYVWSHNINWYKTISTDSRPRCLLMSLICRYIIEVRMGFFLVIAQALMWRSHSTSHQTTYTFYNFAGYKINCFFLILIHFSLIHSTSKIKYINFSRRLLIIVTNATSHEHLMNNRQDLCRFHLITIYFMST